MNRISCLVALEMFKDQKNLWSNDEFEAIQTAIVKIGKSIATREECVEAIKAADISLEAISIVSHYIEKVPPVIIGIAQGNPHIAPQPLTVEALRKMQGQPVWILNTHPCWMFAYSDKVQNRMGYLEYKNYNKSWVAYGLNTENFKD